MQKWDKRRAGRFLGVTVALAGIVIVGLEFNSTIWETAGLILCIIGACIANACRTKGADKLAASHQRDLYGEAKRPSRLAWIFAAVSTLATVGSFVALYVDAAFGSHWQWPIYAILVCGFACVLAWGNLAMKMGWFLG